MRMSTGGDRTPVVEAPHHASLNKTKITKKWKKSTLYYSRGITPKRVTSGGIHLLGLSPGLHSSEETSQRWRVVRDTVSDLTALGIEPKTSGADSHVFKHYPKGKTDRREIKIHIYQQCFDINSFNLSALESPMKSAATLVNDLKSADLK